MVRLTLDRGERCALNSRCEDGKGRAPGTHEALSMLSAACFLDFAVLLDSHAEAACFAVEARQELISHQLRENKMTTHC